MKAIQMCIQALPFCFYVIRQRTSQLCREMPSRHGFSHVAPLVRIRRLYKSNCTKEKLNCIHRFNKGAEDMWRAHKHQPCRYVLVYSHSIYGNRSDCGAEEPVQNLLKVCRAKETAFVTAAESSWSRQNH